MKTELFNLEQLNAAAQIVYKMMPPTPQYCWPLLKDYVNADVWVKHENHTPTGAFKARGGITFMNWLKREYPDVQGIVTATRGNHGQSQALAASLAGLKSIVVVPYGNSVEKNQAMHAFGAQIVEYGEDFDTACQQALNLSKEMDYYLVPSFHLEMIKGVASYALELFTEVADLDTVYVPIGCGSGASSVITVRNLLGLDTKIVGVVSTQANAVKQSFEAKSLINTDTANTFADGMAVRNVVPQAMEIFHHGIDHIVAVDEDEIAQAMRILFKTTHNVAEGAAAASLAALLQEKDRMASKKVAIILSGGNIDTDKFQQVLAGLTPRP